MKAASKVFCLVQAPNAEVAAEVHRYAPSLVADEIVEVKQGVRVVGRTAPRTLARPTARANGELLRAGMEGP